MRRRCGFTLIELMVSIGILMLLASLMMGGLKAAKDKSRRTRARSEVAQLVTAWQFYLADYGRFPALASGSLDEMDQDAVRVLSGKYEEHNQREIPYMDFHEHSEGYRDPWGNFYKIELDNDLDGKVLVDGDVIRRTVAIWSMGTKTNANETADDVCSWKER